MELLKRLLAIGTAAIFLLAAGVGTAAAQNRPDVPYPTTAPTFSTQDTDGNDFDSTYDQCTDSVPEFDVPVIGGLVEKVGQGVCHAAAASVIVIDGAASGLSFIASKAWGDPVGKFTRAVMEGSVQAFSTVMTFWMSVPTPSLTSSDAVNGIGNLTWELQLIALAFGIALGAIRIAIARRHAVADGADETAKMLLRTLFAVSTLPVLVMALHRVGDSFSTWVIQEATGGDITGKINALAWIDEKSGMGPILALVLAGVACFGSVAQLIALLIREAVLAIAVAVAPIAAASSVTGTGRQSWSSIISFTVAALLFKPVASLLYAFAFWASASDTVIDAIVGAVLLAVAGISLPALVRVIAPAVSTISAGGAQAGGLAGGLGSMAGGASGKANSISERFGSGGGGAQTATGTASGGSAPPASGSGTSSQGARYSGSNASRPPSNTTGGAATAASSSSRGALAGSVAKVAGGVGMVAGGVAMGAQVIGSAVSGLAGQAEGAISNGQVPR